MKVGVFLVEQLVRFLEKTETIRNKRISRLELKDCVSKKQNWCRGMEMMHGQTDIQNQTEEEKNP